jgi:hypothetical protein
MEDNDKLSKPHLNLNINHLKTGWRPIHWFARHGDLDLMERFIANGAFAHVPEYVSGLFPV